MQRLGQAAELQEEQRQHRQQHQGTIHSRRRSPATSSGYWPVHSMRSPAPRPSSPVARARAIAGPPAATKPARSAAGSISSRRYVASPRSSFRSAAGSAWTSGGRAARAAPAGRRSPRLRAPSLPAADPGGCAHPGPGPCARGICPPGPPSLAEPPPLSSRSTVARASRGSTPRRASAAGSASKVGQTSPPGDSNTALRVPGTRASTAARGRRRARPGAPASGRRCARPPGVRTPVDIMSRRRAHRRGPGAGPAGEPRGAVQLLDQLGGGERALLRPEQSEQTPQRRRRPRRVPARVARPRPLLAGSQPDGGLGHRERRGIGRGVGAPDLSEHGRHRGRARPARRPEPAAAWELSWRRAGQGGRHEEQVALVDAREELAPQPRQEREAGEQRRSGGGQRQPGRRSANWTNGR